MLIRTLRPCEIAGRTVRAGLVLDMQEQQAQALIEAGEAEPHAILEQAAPAAAALAAQE